MKAKVTFENESGQKAICTAELSEDQTMTVSITFEPEITDDMGDDDLYAHLAMDFLKVLKRSE